MALLALLALLCGSALGNRVIIGEHFRAAETVEGGVQLTVATFNVLSQMKFAQGPTGFPLVTDEAFLAHQPDLTKADVALGYTQSSAENTWIQQILKDLMVESKGPRVELLALQEVDFPIFEGMKRFLSANPGFEVKALSQKSMEEAEEVHKQQRKKYEGKKVPPFKVKDFPYVIYNTASVTKMTCAPARYDGAGLCDFTVAGSKATYKGLFMHASSIGVSEKATIDMISDNTKLDLVMGDLNAHEDAVVRASKGLFLLPTKEKGTKEFGTVLRHVYKLRKVAQCAASTQNFRAVKEARGDQDHLTCNDFEEFCCGKEKHWYLGDDEVICDNTKVLTTDALKGDCKRGSKVCSAFRENPVSPKEAKELRNSGMFSEEDLAKVKNGTLNMAVLSGYLGYGERDWAMKTPTFKASDLNKYTQFQHSQEDYILLAPQHAEKSPAKAHVYMLEEVLKEKNELEASARGLPGKTVPSDHLPLIADLTLEAS